MRKLLLFLSLFFVVYSSPIKAQLQVSKVVSTSSNFDSTELSIQKYYHLATQYKDGNGVAMDYSKAYGYFRQAAELGDSQTTPTVKLGNVYPNPFSSYVKVELVDNVSINLFNTADQQVYEQPAKKLTPGKYIIQIELTNTIPQQVHFSTA